MRVVLFGGTGMVGQGVLRECLAAPDVERVLAVGRTALDNRHEKLEQIIDPELFDLSTHERELTGWNACFFCLGVSSSGMSEEAYAHVTLDLTLSVAQMLANVNGRMTFVYVSGAGTDSTAEGRVMWARVKGKTENALLDLPFAAACMLRPAIIVPGPGIRSKTKTYRLFYALFRPLLPLLRTVFPRYVTTTSEIGRAMLEVVRRGPPRPILESPDIRALGAD